MTTMPNTDSALPSTILASGLAQLRAARDLLLTDALRHDADRQSALDELAALDATLRLRGAATPPAVSDRTYRTLLVLSARRMAALADAALARAVAAEALLLRASSSTLASKGHEGTFRV